MCRCEGRESDCISVYGACAKYVGETFRSAGVTVYSAWKKNMSLTICSA